MLPTPYTIHHAHYSPCSRESGLVQHVAELEAKLQKFIKGGKHVTEEEISR